MQGGSHNARRGFLAQVAAMGMVPAVASPSEAPRPSGRDLERLRLCAQWVAAIYAPYDGAWSNTTQRMDSVGWDTERPVG